MAKPSVIAPAEWRVRHNGWGRITIVDAGGVPILRHPDPVVALEQAHLAACAPLLRYVVAPLVRRLEHIEIDHGIPIMARDERRIGWAWHALHLASPPSQEYATALATRQQLELDWEDAA